MKKWVSLILIGVLTVLVVQILAPAGGDALAPTRNTPTYTPAHHKTPTPTQTPTMISPLSTPTPTPTMISPLPSPTPTRTPTSTPRRLWRLEQ
jgi:hypothetical protein